MPDHIKSDNSPEDTARVVREWLGEVGVKTLFIVPGSTWENGYVESFNGKLRDELLNRESFETLLEARVLIERWREHYNTVRPHSALEYRPPLRSVRPCSDLHEPPDSHTMWTERKGEIMARLFRTLTSRHSPSPARSRKCASS